MNLIVIKKYEDKSILYITMIHTMISPRADPSLVVCDSFALYPWVKLQAFFLKVDIN